MALTSGTKLGPHEIQSPLGAGGMGEVYRARDTRLGRDVAIKVLPSHLSCNPELKTRFEREARAISALSHPHICHLYDIGSQDGTDYLVMELLEGESVAERLRKGPLPLKQALEYGIEIAEALEKAHKNGIVHRDLKPGNVMLTKSGAKLLDFGLAKPAPSIAGSASESMATMSRALTGEGTIVGTYQYMAPEQVQGHEADPRTDLFAFGTMLYEMVTGKRAFTGKSQISVMSAILEKEPEPLSAVQPLTPPALDHVIRRALAKDPDDRWQSAADLKAELKWIAEAGSQAGAPKVGTAKKKVTLLASVCVLLILALAAAGYLLLRAPVPALELRASIPAPPNTTFRLLDDDAAGPAVISPDGTHIAFVAGDDKHNRQVWVRALNGGDARSLLGTEQGSYPFWSPDGKWLGFFASGKLKKVPTEAGPVLELADATRPRGASWGPDNVILFTPFTQTGIYSVPAAGGAIRQITTIDTSVHTTHRWPVWLADGKRFLYLATNHGNPAASGHNGIYVASVDGKENRMLMPADSNVEVAPGYLLYSQNETLMAQPFDEQRAELKGDPVAVAQNVVHNPGTWRGAFDVSRNGVLVYQAGSSAQASELLWLAPGKAPAKAAESVDSYSLLRLSPDGHKLAVTIGTRNSELWIYDLGRDVKTRFTFSSGMASIGTAVWSPDGKRVAFSQTSRRVGGGSDIYVKDAGGTGDPKLLVSTSSSGTFSSITDWSRDGRYLMYRALSANSPSAFYVVATDSEQKPKLFLTGSSVFSVFDGTFSPDGQWVAYVSNENGRTEIYVTSFPDAKGKWQISTDGGYYVCWSRDGRTIFYEKSGGTIMKVPFAARGNDVEIGTPQTYVSAKIMPTRLGGSWDVAPDGRIIANVPLGEEPRDINVVMNWTVGLKK